MALPSDRQMPTLVARQDGPLWRVALPGGREVVAADPDAVRVIARAEAHGAAIKWEPQLTEGEARELYGK